MHLFLACFLSLPPGKSVQKGRWASQSCVCVCAVVCLCVCVCVCVWMCVCVWVFVFSIVSAITAPRLALFTKNPFSPPTHKQTLLYRSPLLSCFTLSQSLPLHLLSLPLSTSPSY